MNGTVKQFLDGLEEMRKVYPFKNEETRVSTYDLFNRSNSRLQIATVDEETGIYIVLEKEIKGCD